MYLPILLWLAAGTLTHFVTTQHAEGNAPEPWWLMLLTILSWPIFAASYLTDLQVIVGWGMDKEDGED
jgi:hypothetical protein